MTQTQLERAVARHTGESLRTIRHLGFRPLEPGPPIEFEPATRRTALPTSAGAATTKRCSDRTR